MENMEERQVEKLKEIWKIWRKSKLNSEKIWKLWRKSQLKVKRYGNYGRKVG